MVNFYFFYDMHQYLYLNFYYVLTNLLIDNWNQAKFYDFNQIFHYQEINFFIINSINHINFDYYIKPNKYLFSKVIDKLAILISLQKNFSFKKFYSYFEFFNYIINLPLILNFLNININHFYLIIHFKANFKVEKVIKIYHNYYFILSD